MDLVDAYPIIVTDKLGACRDFYAEWFGLEVIFESSWFVYLARQGARPWSIAFMAPEHPSAPPGPQPFSGHGVCLELQTADATAEFQKLSAAGAPIRYALTDEPFGQRRFGLFDPAGLWIDVVEQIEPAAGFWDKYMIGPAN